jgi:hypothetical protein
VKPGPLALGIAGGVYGQSTVCDGPAVAGDVVGEYGGDGCGVAGEGFGDTAVGLRVFALTSSRASPLPHLECISKCGSGLARERAVRFKTVVE